MNLAQFIYNHLGSNLFGEGHNCPPGDGLKLQMWQHVKKHWKWGWWAKTSNDGSRVTIGMVEETSHRPHPSYDTNVEIPPRYIVAIALWLVWRYYCLGCWFGLRRGLWYWALSRRDAYR